MAIWVIKDGQREGPYDEQDVRELIYEGTYTREDPAIRDGQFDWTTVGRVLEEQTPPAGPESASTTATAPPPEPPPYVAPRPPEPPPVPASIGAAPLEPAVHSRRPVEVKVIDFDMPFGSMVILMVKWILASIPALLILAAIAAAFWIAFFAMISALLHR